MAEKQNNKKPIYDVNWYDDKYQSIVVFRNWMFLLAVICVSGIFAMTMASYYFVPLKSVSPFVIQIDEKSGMTQVVESQGEQQFTENEMLFRHFAFKYIMARETYNFRTFQDNMNIVRVMSVPAITNSYNTQINSEQGPVKVFGVQIEREAKLISMHSPRLNKTSGESTIEAILEITERGAQRAPNVYRVSVLLAARFDEKFNLTENERFINPLGFTVTLYSSERELTK